MYTNEHQTHPLELRVKALEEYLEEAINIISSKVRPGDDCSLLSWIDEAEAVLNNEEVE